MTHGHELKGGNVEGRGWAGWSGMKWGKWDSCNSIINKYIFLKKEEETSKQQYWSLWGRELNDFRLE